MEGGEKGLPTVQGRKGAPGLPGRRSGRQKCGACTSDEASAQRRLRITAPERIGGFHRPMGEAGPVGGSGYSLSFGLRGTPSWTVPAARILGGGVGRRRQRAAAAAWHQAFL
mmetsp:Transcript_42076/g.99752  ORF Transcript_42076/g.99752 Transcript_42076/m.99752 type:complete len:112 (-) Transcript_42076:734-1069(-)